MTQEEYEQELLGQAMKRIGACVASGDMQTVLVLIKLCKYIVGDDFDAELVIEEK